MRQGLGAGVLAALVVAIVSFAAGATPPMSRSPGEPVASRLSLLHRVLIYAKEGSSKLVDGRWNLGQSEAKLGIQLSPDETKQMMACTGKIVCVKPESGQPVFATAVSVLRPDLLVTAKHVFFKGRGNRTLVSFGRCTFRSHLNRNAAIPVLVEKDQRKGYFLNNEDFIVVRLKRELEGCNAFAINESDASLPEGEQILSVTGYQRNSLNRLSDREPVLAKGTIRSVSSGVAGGPPFYYADVDLDEGGSGGAVFALEDGRPVSDPEGRLVLRGLLVGHGPKATNGKPYSEDRNYTIIIDLQAEFRDLVEGKAHKQHAVKPVPCLQGGAAKITVTSNAVPPPQSGPLAPLQDVCGAAAPDGKAEKAIADCAKLEKELKKLAKGFETLAASRRGKGKREFRLKNDTACPICFSYDRCNEYGCWDEVVRASGKSTLFAGVRERPPVIKNPQFCTSGPVTADLKAPLPPRKPDLASIEPPATGADSPPLPRRKPPQASAVAAEPKQTVGPTAVYLAAKEKAERQGVWNLTAEDIRGLSLDQIRELRGY